MTSLLPLILLVILLLQLQACGEVEPEATTSVSAVPLAVQVEELQPRVWQGRVISFGELEAAREIDVSVDFTGTVAVLAVSEGEAVKKGQMLLELGREKRELLSVQAEEAVQQASALLDEARLMLQRRQELADKDTVSREVLDNARLSLDAAAARYREAVAARQLALRELSESQLYSPVDGIVDHIPVEVGETVLPGTLLLQLHSSGALEVRSWVAEADISYVRTGASADINLPALPGRRYSAVVESVGVNADPVTGNFLVKLVLEASPDLRPGMTAGVELQGLEWPEALVLPEQALVDRDRRRVVFIEDNGIARMREPLLGAGLTDKLLVFGGLQIGDRIITSGLDSIVDGIAVTAVTE